MNRPLLGILFALSTFTLLASGCGGVGGGPRTDNDRAADSPIATVPEPDGYSDALIHGTISVTDTCVLLDEGGQQVLLVFPSSRTSWSVQDQTVTFSDLNGNRFVYSDGDVASFSGGGSSARENGMSEDEFVAAVTWVDRPAPECLVDSRWFVAEPLPPA